MFPRFPAGSPGPRALAPHARQRSLLGLACSAGLLVTTLPVAAQGTATQLDPVKVTGQRQQAGLDLDTPADTGSRLGLSPRETPATVTVVGRDTIEARGAQDTQEILRAIPGVTAHNAPGSIGVSYRGFGATSLSQLYNGIHLQYTIAARPVDSWIVDRVEAVGGASSFLYGAGGVGGTINVITKLAEGREFSEGRLRLGTEGLKEVSLGLNRRLAGEGSGAGSHHARIDLNHRDTGGWIDGNHARATQLAASLRSELGARLRHMLALEHQTESVDRPYWGTPVLNPAVGLLQVDPRIRFENYNSADGIYAQRVHWLRSITDWRASEALTLRNTLYRYDALRDYRNVESYRYNPGNTAVIRSATLLQRHDHEVIGNRLDAVFKGQLGGLRSDWAAGLDLSDNRQTRFPNSIPGTVSTVDPFEFTTERFFTIPGTSPVFNPDRDNRVRTLAAYLENRTALSQGLNLVTALRHERIALDLRNRRAVTAAAPAAYSRSYRPTTGRIGLVFDLSPEAKLYAQFATAADPPSGILSTASFADVMNNSELTTGRQFELGAKFDFWQGRGSATVAAFDITRKNIATQDPANTALTVLVGAQSSRGLELAVGLQAAPGWSLQGNLASVDARFDRFVQGGVSLAGKTPTNTPSTVANLWTTLSLTPSLKAIAGLRHVGKVYANAANTQTWPAYTLLDLGLNWQLDKAVSLVGRVRNAGDRLYAANAGSTQVYLGAPRTADLSLRVQF